jgi:hypothetical protein
MNTTRTIFTTIGVVIVVITLSIVLWIANTGAGVVNKVVNPDAIVENYEEFQTLYNTLNKIDGDMKTICETPDNDKMFDQFSKGAMIAQKRQYMTRWVNEYNAKSKMYTRNLWKSNTLPYQVNEEDFRHYNCLQNKGTK